MSAGGRIIIDRLNEECRVNPSGQTCQKWKASNAWFSDTFLGQLIMIVLFILGFFVWIGILYIGIRKLKSKINTGIKISKTFTIFLTILGLFALLWLTSLLFL